MIEVRYQEELRKMYNPDGSVLRNQQLSMFEILKCIDELCNKHKIPYWLSSGTLLGAIRHGGFIPWDDDVDIEILYSDKKRFINACLEDLPKNLILQYNGTDRSYFSDILKVRDLNTHIDESCNIGSRKYDTKYNYDGIFIDVFTIEPSTLFLVGIANFLTKVLLFFRYVLNFPVIFIKVIYYLNHVVFDIMRFFVKVFKIKKVYYESYGSLFACPRSIKEILPVKKGEFEGRYYNIPNNSDAYLTKLYGNYMILPNFSERNPHHNNAL